MKKSTWLLALITSVFFFNVSCKVQPAAPAASDDDDTPAEEEVNLDPPAAPGTLTVTPGTTSNSITWAAVTNASSYRLYFATTTGVTTSSTAIDSATSPYSHSSLTPSTTYFYKLVAINANGTSGLSAESSGTPTGDITAPTVSSTTPASGSTIVASDSIAVVFSESMDTSTLVVTGTAASGITPVWSTTTSANDTVTITGTFPDGTAKTLIFNVEDTSGNPLVAVTRTYAILGDNAVYVSVADGNDANVGTHDAPKATISAGLTAAATHSLSEVRVAKGTYNADGPVFAANTTVKGGYAQTDFPGAWVTARDLTENATIVQSTSVAAGTSSAPSHSVEVGSSITVDGFTIKGPVSGTFTAGVYISFRDAFTLSNCFISGGGGATRSSGIYGSSVFSGAVITNNTITGGTGTTSTYGIWATSMTGLFTANTVSASSGSATNTAVHYDDLNSGSVTNNTITGGGGTSSFGIWSNVFAGTVSGNTIHGGSGTTAMGIRLRQANFGDSSYSVTNNTVYGGSSSSTTTIGVHVDGGGSPGDWNPTVSRNRIHGGEGTATATGLVNVFVTSKVFNNYIFGGVSATTKGVVAESDSYFITLRNNTINGGAATTESSAFYNEGTTGLLDNNLLFTSSGTSRYCLNYFGDAGTIRNNLFKACPTASLITRFASTLYATAADVDARPFAENSFEHGTSAANLVDGDDPDATWSNANYALAVGSSANASTGGLDGAATFGFTTDFAGATRTGGGATGWSIGAFELD